MAQLASLFSSTHPSFTGSVRSTQRTHSTLRYATVAVAAIPTNQMIATSLSHMSVSSSAPTHMAACHSVTPP